MKIKFVRLLEYPEAASLDFLHLPPLPLAIFKSLLNKKHKVVIDDLGIKLIHDKDLYDELLTLGFQDKSQEEMAQYLRSKEDERIEKILARIIKKIDYKGFSIVALSVPNFKCVPLALLLAKKIKEKGQVKIVLGGWPFLGGVDQRFFCQFPFIDYVSIEKSYYPFVELIKSFSDSKEHDIKGICSAKYLNIPREVLDPISALPAPIFDGLPLKSYRVIPKSTGRFWLWNQGKKLPLPYFFSQGCSYSCSFCSNSARQDKCVSFNSASKIVTDLASLSKKYHSNCFFFFNHAVNLNNSLLNDLCDLIIKKKLNILWSDSAKPKKIDKQLLLKMKKSGCICLSWGLESGDEVISRSMNKGHTVVEAALTLQQAHEVGIWNRVNIIVGYPGETEKQFQNTKNFLRNNVDFIDDLMVHEFFLANSDIFANPAKYGIRLKGSNQGGFASFIFDEVNGLKWEDKLIQMRQRHQDLTTLFRQLKNNIFLLNQDYNYNIFYLYEKYKTKEKIRENLKDFLNS